MMPTTRFYFSFTTMQMSSSVDVGGLGAKKSATYVGQHETKSICLLPRPWGPSTPKGPKGTRCTHFCGLLLRHATKLLWGLVNLRTLRMSTKKKSQIIALNGATPAAAKRENRLSSRNPPNALTTPFVGLLSHYIMMIIFIAASRDIFLMSPPSAQMAYNGAEETETAPKRVSV